MRLQALIYLYLRRIRTHPVQELLAGFGIAVGVALSYAVLVANSSVVASAEQMVDGVVGVADLQLTARGGSTFDRRTLAEVRALPGVARAAPALERRAVLVGPGGAEAAVSMVSVDRSLALLSGRLTQTFLPGGLGLEAGAIMVPGSVAERLGVGRAGAGAPGRLPRVRMLVRGRAADVTVAAVMGRDSVGSLTEARAAIVTLATLQRATGLEGRVSRILVMSEPGRAGEVERGLAEIAGDRLDVAPADAEIALLRQATGPTDQVTGFFAAVSALLGLLLAFNAMLLTAPERRRLVAALRVQGFRRRQVVTILMFQALVLGVAAVVAGLLVGDLLSRTLFGDSPDYLAPGFTLGGRAAADLWPLFAAGAGGVAMSCLASAPPLLDLRRGRAVDAVFHEPGSPGNAIDSRAVRLAVAGSVVAFAAASVLLLALPGLALVASGLLAIGTLLAIPVAFRATIALLQALVDRVPRLSTLTVALLSMRATTLRSLALASTGAVAVFGCVAIGGARDDLLAGIGSYADGYVGTADIWVTNPSDNQATSDFAAAGLAERIAAVEGVRGVRRYRGNFLDVAGRRVWVIARPEADPAVLPRGDIVDGDLDAASAALRSGGAAAVSTRLAAASEVGVGDRLDLPTPVGARTVEIVATTTNLGWAPGAVVLSARDHRRWWPATGPSAIEVDVAAGDDPGSVRDAVAALLGRSAPGLRATLSDRRAEIIKASARQGLERLSQIALLLQIAAVLAMAAAMGAAVWQRRPALAALRIQSFSPRQLLGLLLIEATAVLGAGAVTGALGGTYGRIGADRFLSVVTGFPVLPGTVGWGTVATVAVVVAAALAVVAVPGWFAARVPPRLGLGAE